jgi:hypothetical protein
MHSQPVLAGIGLFTALAMTIPASAVPCYAKQGSICVKKSYGNLDSTCENACAVGKTAQEVQKALKDRGHDPGPIDGIAGTKTQKALKALQAEQGLPQTGRMDKATLEKLGVELK